MSLQNLQNIFTNPIINTLFAICGLIIAAKAYRVAILTYWYPFLEKQKDRHLLNKNLGQRLFDKITIKRLTEYYIRPKFSIHDSTPKKEIHHAPSVAAKDLFEEVNRFLDKECGCRHLLILADSGTGKTSFTLNYYAYNLRKRKEAHKISLIPLGRKDADSLITKIPDKEECILFLDALEEDTNAIDDHCQRIRDLMEICKAFRRVIITCRTQFFSRDEEISVNTGVIRIDPVPPGKKIYKFRKLYLSPFDDKDVVHYIKQRYHFWDHAHRKKAFELVNKIPLLTMRPMLLAHMSDIIKRGVEIKTSYQLYEVMVETWLDRESGRVDKKMLRTFLEQLSVDLFMNRKTRGEEQVTKEELLQLVRQWRVPLEGWKLRGRSLLNRDTAGNYKFAHRSIMEFLFVKRWLRGDKQARQAVLTDQMGKFLVETDLYGADLGGVNLSGVNLCKVNLSGVNLHGANLSEANLDGTNLIGANLSGANLLRANLQKTKIDNTTQIDAKWQLVWKIINHKTKGRNFSKADLSGANLSGVNLRGANLCKAHLCGADLHGTNLIGANLCGADLCGVNLVRTSLSGVNHSWMDLGGTNLRRANLYRVSLRGMDLRGMDLSGSNLRRADLSEADLRRADLCGVNLCRANVRRADLRGVDLRGANLCRADLREADLRGVNLSRMDLSGADLSGADLCGVNLIGANLIGANILETNLCGVKHDYTTKWFKSFDLPTHKAAKQ
jgi:uncharacterized protein YjbI with pentapeptide repeats